MSVPNRSRDKNGEFREKRSDTKIETLKKTYSEFENINGNMHLGTLKEKYDTNSLDGVLKALRKDNKDK